jgi:hypothetical protein
MQIVLWHETHGARYERPRKLGKFRSYPGFNLKSNEDSRRLGRIQFTGEPAAM